MLERPTKAGLWHREGKNYRVWKRDDCSFGAEHIDANGMIGAYYGNDLPTGNWQPLAPSVALSEARERFLAILRTNLPNTACVGFLANKAAEEFGRVERSEKPFADQQVDEAQSRLMGWARRDRPSCRILSEGDRCTCLLCDIDGLAFRARQITDLKATIARLEGEVAKLTKDLEREERDHCETIEHRDQHEERINRIVGCLGLGEYESSWTSLNDPSERAIEAIEELQRRVEDSHPEVIIGKGQAVTREGVYAALADDADATDTWDCCPKEVGEQFCEHNRYIYIGPIPTFPPRLTEAAKIIQHNTREDEAMQLIRAERQRQISAEGWSADHDEAHHNGELEDAALCYWHCATKPGHVIRVLENNSDTKWPWESRWFKPFKPSRGEFPEVDNVRCLVKAGALMLAEIDRLKRTGAEVHCGYGQQVWDIAADLAKLLPPRPTFAPPPNRRVG